MTDPEPRNSSGNDALDAVLDYGLACAEAASFAVRGQTLEAWNASLRSYAALDRFLDTLKKTD